ncbi:PepSY-associated TM helix domain-containing protein [Methylobacterium sp. J-092]|uniref:PepSY-associated TM helix domain-containing protein n=1 Tax=Methylobacterium sp. J-092 TaxID=2836667 RepID=UPI001FBB4620|nr:PepSY-associated TM helix domain-containing protein [Methylobacterium sp. J-092]MCJ2006381.1 PepSY domain-containing protein [Methylobacterium sp. J-092]
MRNGFRQSMAWLHAWSGLVVGWVLFSVFVTGTASYYRSEISQWMRPELRAGAPLSPAALGHAADLARAHLEAQAKGARSWFITLPSPDRPTLDLFWRRKPGTPPGQAMLDPATGAAVAVRDTRGGDFLYRFHFELSMAPLWGRWIVGSCAMIMLVALVSGIVTHRRIFVDLFTFRRHAKSAQRGWLDAHNVTGVLALPFHLMITYTGIVTLALMYMPWGVTTAYRGDAQAFFAESGQITAARPPAGRPAPLAPFGPMVERALAMNAEPLERITVQNPGDANATVVAVFEEPHGLRHRHPQVAFDGTSGAVIETLGAMKPAAGTFTAMVGLHEAHFAGPALRVLFFLSGAMGAAMVATGLILWTVARVPKPGTATRAHLGMRLVQALNVGTIAGLPIAIAGYFLANRLLPLGMAERREAEVTVFFGAWILATLMPLALPPRTGWTAMLATAAALLAAVPVVGGLATGRHLLASLRAGDAAFYGFDLALLGLGAAFAFAACKAAGLRRRPLAERPRPGAVAAQH